MTKKNQDFDMNQGETKIIDIPDTDDEDNGGTLNISGRQEIKWILKNSKSDDTNILEKSEGSGIVVTDASVGAYEVTIDPADTNNIARLNAKEQSEFYHRVRYKDGNGRPSDLLEGHITIDAT